MDNGQLAFVNPFDAKEDADDKERPHPLAISLTRTEWCLASCTPAARLAEQRLIALRGCGHRSVQLIVAATDVRALHLNYSAQMPRSSWESPREQKVFVNVIVG